MRLGRADPFDDFDNLENSPQARQRRVLRTTFTLLILMILLEDPQPAAQRSDIRSKAEAEKRARESEVVKALNSDLTNSVHASKRYTSIVEQNELLSTNVTEQWREAYPSNFSGFYLGEWEGGSVSEDYWENALRERSTSDGFLHPQKLIDLDAIATATAAKSDDIAYPVGVGIYYEPISGGGDEAGADTEAAKEISSPHHDLNHQTSLTLPAGTMSMNLYSKNIPQIPSIALLRGIFRLHDTVVEESPEDPQLGGVVKPRERTTDRDVHIYASGIVIKGEGRGVLLGNYPKAGIVAGSDGKKVADDKKNNTDVSGRRILLDELMDLVGDLVGDDDGDDNDDGWMNFFSSDGNEGGGRDSDIEESFSSAFFPREVDEDYIEGRRNLKQFLLPFAKLSSSAPVSVTSSSPSASLFTKNARECQFEVVLDVNSEPVRKEAASESQWAPAYAMEIIGDLYSRNCDLNYGVKASAIRVDWETATERAINYSIYMTVVCLVQIGLLLRQLHHSQSGSVTPKVSILMLAMMAMFDALSTVFHVSLSILIQDLFSAFLTIVFFSVLIFAVLELKYMAIIMTGRAPDQSPERTRQEITFLHARFYGVFGCIMLLFYQFKGTSFGLFFFTMSLASFWVPQILLNVVTECRKPLHKHFIIGMSLTRLYCPLYIFGVPGNFLSVAFPSAAKFGLLPNYWLCFVMSLWVLFQAAVLVSQQRYGTRWFIPARYLPPKFDYSRPLPPSMRRHGGGGDVEMGLIQNDEAAVAINDVEEDVEETAELLNRTMPKEASGPTMVSLPPTSENDLECVICCESIDSDDRKNYMLAPCEHLFHKQCLLTWMEQKMECPVCRAPLPAI